jgi:hypothetical protein
MYNPERHKEKCDHPLTGIIIWVAAILLDNLFHSLFPKEVNFFIFQHLNFDKIKQMISSCSESSKQGC